jgi:hypothetical protein
MGFKKIQIRENLHARERFLFILNDLTKLVLLCMRRPEAKGIVVHKQYLIGRIEPSKKSTTSNNL